MCNIISTDIKKNAQFVALFIFISLLSACVSHKPIMLYEQAPASDDSIVTLTMPVAIDVVYHNGNRSTYMPAYQAFVSYKLLSGEHVLGFRYQDIVTDEEGNSESIKSRTVIVKFNAVAGEHYTIDFTPPKSIEKALALEKTLKLTLSHNNKIIASSYPAPQSPNADWFSAEPFTAEIGALFTEGDDTIEVGEEPNKNAPALAHLHYWWSKASETEKQAFSSFYKK